MAAERETEVITLEKFNGDYAIREGVSIVKLLGCLDSTVTLTGGPIEKLVCDDCVKCKLVFNLERCATVILDDVEDFSLDSRSVDVPRIIVDNCSETWITVPEEWGYDDGKSWVMACSSTWVRLRSPESEDFHEIPDGDHDIILQTVTRRIQSGKYKGEFETVLLPTPVPPFVTAQERCKSLAEGEELQGKAVTTLMNRRSHATKEEMEERHDPPETLREKVRALAELLRNSKHAVVYTGAGISTSAKIPDYRGPNGAWTRADQHKMGPESVALEIAQPTVAHRVLAALVREGLVKYVVTTNMDGLHIRGGVKPEDLAELHGSCFVELCPGCKTRFDRNYDVIPDGQLPGHLTGAVCEKCGAALKENIINFGENLEHAVYRVAAKGHARRSDLALVLGTSMKVSPACYLPRFTYEENGGQCVIANLQRTPFDKFSATRLFGTCDDVMAMLAEELKLDYSK